MAAKRKEINKQRVLDLASNMCTTEEIAADLECSPDTIERRCAAILKKGRGQAKLSLRARQFQLAMGMPAQYDKQTGKQMFAAIQPSVTMQIWLGKQYLGQSDKFTVGEGDAEGFAFVKSR
jgi:hypothetical protein